MSTITQEKTARLRRVRRSRGKIFELGVAYLSVHRTPRHIYAQLFAPRGTSVLAAASSLDASIKGKKPEGGKCGVATAVGKLIAERAKAKGVTRIAFDRSGCKYHGRIKALAESARANGLEF